MKKIVYIFLLFVTAVSANPGDSTTVRVFENFHMNRYGNFDRWATLPDAASTSQRVWLKYTLGCTENGQCEWDYTIKLYARQRTGLKDSIIRQAPSFRVNGALRDSVLYATDTTYITSFNTTTKRTDSVPSTQILLVKYSNTATPLIPSDSLRVWPAGYKNYYYDTAGAKIDSVIVPEMVKLNVVNTPYYDVFQVIHDIEIGRLISPYAKTFPKTFKYDYVYDVTDYANLLNDSVEFRIKYEGYSYGFTSTMDVIYVEGTPVREAMSVVNIYNGSFNYGNPNNSIENQLTAKTFTVPTDASSVKLKVFITGHGGEQNENCAEFCPKFYYLKLNNQSLAQQLVWKDNCGSNAIINQPGTWIYNRANWCPGERVPVYEYPLNLAPGSTHTLDMDMEPFIANGAASYNIAVQLVYYKAYNYTKDLAIDEIISPSTNFWHNRVNPICDNAKIRIKNMGSDTIRTATIRYQIGGAAPNLYEWRGSLSSEASVDVTLPWLIWPSDLSDRTFKVDIINVNGGDDDNFTNNTMRTSFALPAKLPRRFIIETRTNNKPEHNQYKLVDSRGVVYANKTFAQANTVYRDTFELSIGCYNFRFDDDGGNGLTFWATPGDGNGYVRFLSASTPIQVLKTFNYDFGSFLEFNFTSEFSVSTNEINQISADQIVLYPSPASGFLKISSDVFVAQSYVIWNTSGKLLKSNLLQNDAIAIDELPVGIYFIELTDAAGQRVTKKFNVVK